MQNLLGWYVHWDVDIADSQIENCVAHIQFITNRGTKPVLVVEESAHIPKFWFDIGGLFTLWME